jgi:hypothetical protein
MRRLKAGSTEPEKRMAVNFAKLPELLPRPN